jgi:predicted nicotinamide N-methyase
MSDSRQRPAAPEFLRSRFALASSQVNIGAHRYELLRPGNIDDLISEEEFTMDDRIPYWAECWPSSRVLAERLIAEPGGGRTLLELGCGIGLVSMAAAQAGFDVLATDYYADALEFTAANAERHGISTIDTRLIDWRKLPEDLGTFDVVVASDVLYEREQPPLVARVFAETLRTGGLGLLTDPGRRPADGFIAECEKLGVKAECVELIDAVDAGAELVVAMFEIRRLSDHQ